MASAAQKIDDQDNSNANTASSETVVVRFAGDSGDGMQLGLLIQGDIVVAA